MRLFRQRILSLVIRQQFDPQDFVLGFVRCYWCGRTLGQLRPDGKSPDKYGLLYGCQLDPPVNRLWLLKPAHKPSKTYLAKHRMDPSNEVPTATLIPLTDRVRCLCDRITSLAHLRSTDFASPTIENRLTHPRSRGHASGAAG
jgi:hypothetical protein